MRPPDGITIVIPTIGTTSELLTEVHRLNFRDIAINGKLIQALRKLADAVESGDVGIKGIQTTLSNRVGDFPSVSLAIDLLDREHELKTSKLAKEHEASSE